MSDELGEAARLVQSGDLAGAARYLDDARKRAADRPDLAFGQAIVAAESGRQRDAIHHFREALALLPAYGVALSRLAAILTPAQAIPLLIRAARLAPDQASNWVQLSQAYRNLRHDAGALDAAEAAVEAAPANGSALAARALVRHALGALDAAHADLAAALVLEPSRPDHWMNLALVSNEAGKLDSALREMDRARTIDPGRGHAEWGLALIHWLKGDLLAAWRHFDGRLARRGIVRADIASAPQWRGEEFRGKTLLIWAEQGQGDTLQFIRYYDAIKARGGRVILEVQPSLQRLFEAQKRFDAVYARNEIQEAYDFQMALMSAPVIFQTSAETIPWNGPYLHPPRNYALPPRRGLKVGLVWAGNPENSTADRVRSFDLSTYDPLFEIEGVAFYALQLGERRVQSRGRHGLVDLAPDLVDFAATADALSELDLLISSCTSVPHLAGAMGKPVWLLVNKASDYRWGLSGRSTPWYPSFRLYRQERLRDWSAPIAAIKGDLEEIAGRPLKG